MVPCFWNSVWAVCWSNTAKVAAPLSRPGYSTNPVIRNDRVGRFVATRIVSPTR